MPFYTNEEIKAACLPLERAGQYLDDTLVVFRVSDAPPEVCRYADVPSYIGRMHIWGIATDEAQAMVAERRRQYRETWS
jgi:hypothetical protein